MSIRENVKVIGLTGMSGAGKSTACNLFKSEGFDIIDCDKICRDIVRKGESCLNEIAASFGSGVLTEEGEYNRREVGRIIFGDSEKRLMLNGIMYPYVSYIVINRILEARSSFAVIDAPTLFESGIDDICDIIVSITADRETLIERIMNRDNTSRELAENRLKSQQTIDFYKSRSDYVIDNSGDSLSFIKKVETAARLIKEGK